MKKIWIGFDVWNKDFIIDTIEAGVNGLVLPEDCSHLVKNLGRILTIAKDGDLKLGEDVFFFEIKSVNDEKIIIDKSIESFVIVKCTNWTIIPIENIIAKGKSENIILEVKNLFEAQIAFEILEKGVGGVFIKIDNFFDLKENFFKLLNFENAINMFSAKIEIIKYVGIGDRVCLDTCTSMKIGQGVLVGNTSNFLFLINAENVKNQYVNERSFRVNAGAIHMYVKVLYGKTKYLSEFSSGDQISIVDHYGSIEKGTIGRVKIEKRPLMLVKAKSENFEGSIIVQNAETVRFVKPNGEVKSVAKLKEGDDILVSLENGGRHFGVKINESIKEK